MDRSHDPRLWEVRPNHHFLQLQVTGITDHPPIPIDSHPNKDQSHGKNAHSLINAEFDHDLECYKWMDSSNDQRCLYLCHRLDSPTSGVILGVSTQSLATTLRQAFADRKVRKTYYAVVQSKGKFREGLWKDPLVVDRSHGKLRVGKGKGPIALTSASIIRQKGRLYGLSLIKLEPKTGRTHQLRVQCSLRKMPILGDQTYGDFSFNRKIARATKVDRLCLHAGEIEFRIQTGNQTISFFADSPLPRSFGKLLA